MSNRGESAERQENGSHRSNDGSGSASRHNSESPPPSRARSRSPRPTARSRSRSPRKRSHSSRSHTRRYSRHRREHSKSRSRSPTTRGRRNPRERRSPFETFERKSSRYERNSGYHSDSRNRGEGYHRDHSRSPMSSRRRHVGNRENPPTGRCLGIFGLSIYTQERDLKDVFAKYGALEDVQIVYDAQSGRSRGFAFIYYEDRNDAQTAKERCNGIEIDGRKIRVDFSITQRAHTPTPGIYMGKPTYSAPRYRGGGSGSREGRESGGRFGGGGYERSPSPYYSREKRSRYSRSRSRSHSPRKYHYY